MDPATLIGVLVALVIVVVANVLDVIVRVFRLH